MANFIKLSEYWAIEESKDGRFLTNRKTKQRVVDLGEEDIEITYINLETESPYRILFHNFKVKNKHGTGLMQFEGLPDNIGENDFLLYNSFRTFWAYKMLKLEDVLTIPTEYDNVSINYNSEDIRVYFPIAQKNGKYDIFNTGNKLENASNATAIDVSRHLSKMLPANYITQIISYKDDLVYVISDADEIIFTAKCTEFPKLCFIRHVLTEKILGTSSVANCITDIWMYDANGNVGIVYIDTNQKVQSYIIKDVSFSLKDNMCFINEYYIIRHDDAENTNHLYFKGLYSGKISYGFNQTECKSVLITDAGVFLGRNFRQIQTENSLELFLCNVNICHVEADEYDTEITLNWGFSGFTFKYNSKTDEEVQ